MYYEINVSKDGQHLFATAERSLLSDYDARRVWNLFCEKFPADEGYSLNLSRVEQTGTTLRVNP